MVMIDELDRCRPSYAIELLEVAKHLFSTDRIVFVLAVNCDQLAHSVTALYGNDFDAEGYLRRFFDVDFQLPEPDRQAFIRAQLQATGIYDYFDQMPRTGASETPEAMLSLFFGASDLSFRTVGQAIHRLGLLYASLRRDQHDYGLATTVALILRTMDTKLYYRFVAGEVSDGDVVDAIFSRPGLKTPQYDDLRETFEAAVILAGLEDVLSNLSPSEDLPSPLMDRYRKRSGGDHKSLFDDEDPDKLARRAGQVVSIVEQHINQGRGHIGFRHAVRRLELLSTALIGNQPDPSTATP